MRVFVGIKASEDLQEKIIDWQEKHKNLPVRFIKPENLHTTLIPPWYEKNINKLIKYLFSFKSPVRNFQIKFDHISLVGNPTPKLFWAGGQTPDEILKLQKSLSVYLKRKTEKRVFQTHITIARFRPRELKNIKNLEFERNISWKQEVLEFTLFESVLSPRGAEYHMIETFKI